MKKYGIALIMLLVIVLGFAITYNETNPDIYYQEVEYTNNLLDLERPELNNHSLREVFEDENKILNPYLTTSSNWVEYGVTSVITFNYAIIFDGIATTYFGFYQDISTDTFDKLYYRYNQYHDTGDKINHTIHDYGTFDNTLNLRVDSISGENSVIIESKINGIRIFFQEILDWDYNYTFINQLLLINLTSIGIDTLTVAQMDYWYQRYMFLKEKEDSINVSTFKLVANNVSLEGLGLSVFSGIRDFYLRLEDLADTIGGLVGA